MTTVQIFRRQTSKLIESPWNLALLLGIWGMWLWLYSPTLSYLGHVFTLEDFRTNQIILIGIIGLVIYRWVESRDSTQLDKTFQPSNKETAILPLFIVIGGTALWLATERWLAINTISATLFGISTYGLVGLSLNKERWWRGFPIALLIIGTLPFGAHIETFLGYPLRIATAKIVGDALAAAGFAYISVDTILIFENGVSNVDLPCSGVQSLWTGSLFFLAASWLEDKKIGLRWLISIIIFFGALILANTFRVFVLVTLGEALGWQLAAKMLHVPLGVLGFVAACAIALAMLQKFVPPAGRKQTDSAKHAQEGSESAAIQPHIWKTQFSTPIRFGTVAAVILVSAILYVAKPIGGQAVEAAPLIFPDEITLTEQPIADDINAWLTQDGADSAERFRFEWESEAGTRTGSIILISSRSWRAHHRPERCFEVYGLDVEDNGTHLVTPSMPIRQVLVSEKNTGDDHQAARYRAVYWFQSADTITDDYSSRMWSDLTQPNTRWTLVSVLFDEDYPADDPAIQDFYLAMNNTVSLNLQGTAK